jgi:hypothetical protein
LHLAFSSWRQFFSKKALPRIIHTYHTVHNAVQEPSRAKSRDEGRSVPEGEPRRTRSAPLCQTAFPPEAHFFAQSGYRVLVRRRSRSLGRATLIRIRGNTIQGKIPVFYGKIPVLYSAHLFWTYGSSRRGARIKILSSKGTFLWQPTVPGIIGA